MFCLYGNIRVTKCGDLYRRKICALCMCTESTIGEYYNIQGEEYEIFIHL